jgi:hypothetical protein
VKIAQYDMHNFNKGNQVWKTLWGDNFTWVPVYVWGDRIGFVRILFSTFFTPESIMHESLA